jgi:hypothetical protein
LFEILRAVKNHKTGIAATPRKATLSNMTFKEKKVKPSSKYSEIIQPIEKYNSSIKEKL